METHGSIPIPEHQSIFTDTYHGVPSPAVPHRHPYPTRFHGPIYATPRFGRPYRAQSYMTPGGYLPMTGLGIWPFDAEEEITACKTPLVWSVLAGKCINPAEEATAANCSPDQMWSANEGCIPLPAGLGPPDPEIVTPVKPAPPAVIPDCQENEVYDAQVAACLCKPGYAANPNGSGCIYKPGGGGGGGGQVSTTPPPGNGIKPATNLLPWLLGGSALLLGIVLLASDKKTATPNRRRGKKRRSRR